MTFLPKKIRVTPVHDLVPIDYDKSIAIIKAAEEKKYRKDPRFADAEMIKREQEWIDFLTKVTKASSSLSVGFLSSLVTLGFHDSAIFKLQKSFALKELEKDILVRGYKVKDKLDDEHWIVADENNNQVSINAADIIKGSFPKDLQQLIAAETNLDITSTDMLMYNIGKTFGSIKSIGKIAKKLASGLTAAPTFKRLHQAGTTGWLYGGVEQLQSKLEGEDVDFEEWHRTGGIFAGFGVASIGLSGIANSYKMGKFLKSPKGAKWFEELPMKDRKTLLAAGSEAHRIAQKTNAQELLAANKLYASQGVKPVGWDASKVGFAEKVVKAPTMTMNQWYAAYGPKLQRIIRRSAGARAQTKAAQKAGDVMTKDLLAAPGKPRPVADLMKKPGTEEAIVKVSDVVKKSPYLNMPLEEVENLAHYGVHGAKRFLEEANLAPPIPASNAQRNKIVVQAVKHGLGEDNLKRLMHDVSQVDEIEQLTKDEAGELLERLDNYEYMGSSSVNAVVGSKELLVISGMADAEMNYLRKIAGSDQAYNKVVNYLGMLGGFPTDESLPDLIGQQKEIIRDLRIVAKRQQKFMKHKSKMDARGDQADMLGKYQHIGYALDLMEQRSGVPLRRDWSDAVQTQTHWRNINESIVWDAAKKAGISRLGRMGSIKTTQQAVEWVTAIDDEARAVLWNGMDTKTRRYAEALEELYQGPAATRLRWAQFVKWDYNAKKAAEKLNAIRATGKAPTKEDFKNAQDIINAAKPYDATPQDLIDARAAFALDQGLEYLEAATWGSRVRYAPSANLSSLLDEGPGGSIPQEVFYRQAELGTLPMKPPKATYPRKGKAEILKSGNAFMDVLNHMNRLTDFASTFEITDKIWSNLGKANLSTTDEANFRKMMDALRGIHHPLDDWVKKAAWVNTQFWRQFLVGDPRGSVKFAYRQMFQNPALALSQFDSVELAKTLAAFPHFTAANKWVQDNPKIKEAFTEYYDKHVAENKRIYRHMLANSNSYSGLGLVSRAGAFFDLLGGTPAITDRLNRKIFWPVAYSIVYRNVEAFKTGKIDAPTLWKRLTVDNMPTSYALELKTLLGKQEYSEVKSRYAEYRTEMVHMRYNPLLRSVQEMSPAGRLIFGAIVFGRGVMNIAAKQGLEPMLYGNPARAWTGFKTLTKLLIGGFLANELSERTIGYSIYDIPRIIMGIGPLAPGASSIVEVFSETNQAIRQAPPGTSPAELAVIMAKVGAKNLEAFIGVADVARDYYRVQNDLKYAHLWDMAFDAAKSDWEKINNKPFKKTNRDVRDKILIMFFDVEPQDKKSDWQQLQKQLSNRGKRTFK
jgi:hypothetical protein